VTGARIVRLGVDAVAPEVSRPKGVLEGDPVTTLHNCFTDATGRFFCGVWESTPGRWSVSYGENELCLLLSGSARLVAEGGAGETFRAGDAFVIPRGFKGTWETLEPLRKLYAIFEP
jgi:uncharacterized cupin superfamily protein